MQQEKHIGETSCRAQFWPCWVWRICETSKCEAVSVVSQEQKPDSIQWVEEQGQESKRRQSLGPAGYNLSDLWLFPLLYTISVILELLFTSSNFSQLVSVFHFKPSRSQVTATLAWPVSWYLMSLHLLPSSLTKYPEKCHFPDQNF